MVGKYRGFSHCLYKKKNPRFDYFYHWIPSRFVLHPGTGRGYFVECELMGAASVHTRFLSWARKGEISVMIKTYSNKNVGCGKHAVIRVKLRPFCVFVPICHWTLRCVLFPLKRLSCDSNALNCIITLFLFSIAFFSFTLSIYCRCLPKGRKGIQETEWNLLWVVM